MTGYLMKRILIVKVTSLGDIVQALPVIADIKRAFPGVQVDWAADEAFAEVVHWSQSVDRVLCAPLRRFKKARRWADFKAWMDRSFARTIRRGAGAVHAGRSRSPQQATSGHMR